MLKIAMASRRLLADVSLRKTGLIGHGRCGLRLATITTMKDILSSFNHARTMSLVAIGFQPIAGLSTCECAAMKSLAMS